MEMIMEDWWWRWWLNEAWHMEEEEADGMLIEDNGAWGWWWRKGLRGYSEAVRCEWKQANEGLLWLSWLAWLMVILFDGGWCHGFVWFYRVSRGFLLLWWGWWWLGLVNRVFFFLSSLSLKTSSSSPTLETLAQLNNYESNIFHRLLILSCLYSQACKTRVSISSLLLFILLMLNLKNI